MSALDGWIDIFRTGEHTDSAGNKRTWTAAELDGMVHAHEHGDSAPVVVGHPSGDAPAYGWAAAFRRVGDRLQARLERINPKFREAVEAGSYAGRSVSIVRTQAGFRVRHIGFLGGTPPAIEGLAPTQFSAPADFTYDYAAGDARASQAWGWRVLHRVLGDFRDWLIAEKGLEAADRIVGRYDLQQLDDARRDLESPPERPGYSSPTLQTTLTDDANGGAAPAAPSPEAGPSDTGHPVEHSAGPADPTVEGEPAMPEKTAAEIEAEEQRLAADRAAFEAEKAEFAGRQRVRDADAALEAHVKEGRVLPAERAGLAAVMAALPEGEITFTAADGAEAKKSPREVLEGLFAALPVRVNYREVAPSRGHRLGGQGHPADSDSTVPQRARLYHAKMAGAGISISMTEAVDAVREGKDK